jgi:hypothetical protein
VRTETQIGAEMARRAVWVGPVVAAMAALVGGAQAALGAAVGVAVVVGNFLLSGWLLSWAAQRSPNVWGAMALGSFLARFVMLTGLVAFAWLVLDLSRVGLVIGLGVGYLGLLILQARQEMAR